jgi:hypothetical protein
MATRANEYQISEDDWGELTGNMAEVGGEWTAYVPTLGGTGWSLGNGTQNDGYRLQGQRLVGRSSITVGSTTTAGTGQLTLTLPTGVAFTGAGQACAVSVFDDSAGLVVACGGFVASAGAAIQTTVTSSTITFASADVIAVYYEIEIDS